ncbi:MAG: amylo-alpha-1,6-glucosidase [Candidatus Altiarchaeota archaeon]
MKGNAPQPKVRQLFKPLSWDRHHIQFDVLEEGVDSARRYEWILTNGIGGYCSQTVSGENLRAGHGLLVAADEELERTVFLKSITETVNSQPLAPHETGLSLSFDAGLDMARFNYGCEDYSVSKTHSLIQGQNTLVTSYEVVNKGREALHFQAEPCAGISSPGEKAGCKSSPVGGNGFLVVSEQGCVIHYSPTAKLDGKKCSFTASVEAGRTEAVAIVTAAGKTENGVRETVVNTSNANKRVHTGVLGDRFGSHLMSLLSTTRSFIIDFKGKKNILPGYHDAQLSSRDALISLPGTCLIQGDFKTAEKVLELHLNHVWGGRLPSSLLEKNSFTEFDAGLWLIDRVNKYVNAVDEDDAKAFLHTYWWTLKDVLNQYMKQERDGVLRHGGGTWLGDERENAVEVQGLWFNSLKVMGKLSDFMEDELVFDTYIEDAKKAFDEVYWNGSFLMDCEGDGRLRPSQLIVLSLDYSPVENVCAIKILSACERKLLTPAGLRTLAPDDDCYEPDALGEGAAVPWLLGPFARAYVKHFRERGVKNVRDLLSVYFEKATSEACLGTVSHHYGGDKPYEPRGCVSYAPSVAEPVSAYFEDVLNRKTG